MRRSTRCSLSLDLSDSEAHDLFQLLTTTYARYIDQPSREAVESVLLMLASRDSTLDHTVQWIRTEAERVCSGGAARYERTIQVFKEALELMFCVSSSAASSRFVLLKWCCVLYPTEVKRKNVGTWKALLESMAMFLNSLLDENGTARRAIRRTSVVCTRRAFRSVSTETRLID